MDCSPEYIKMRLGARSDLLDGTPPEMGISMEGESLEPEWITPSVFVDIKGDFYYHRGIDYCQLDRQDQLQEMLGLPLWQLNFKFIDWLCDLPYDGHIRHEHLQFTSMEQLLLAFVMHELYQKKWSMETGLNKDWYTRYSITDI